MRRNFPRVIYSRFVVRNKIFFFFFFTFCIFFFLSVNQILIRPLKKAISLFSLMRVLQRIEKVKFYNVPDGGDFDSLLPFPLLLEPSSSPLSFSLSSSEQMVLFIRSNVKNYRCLQRAVENNLFFFFLTYKILIIFGIEATRLTFLFSGKNFSF